MRTVISPYASKRIGDTDNFEVAWNEWDGSCMCTRINKRGTITFVSPEGYDPDLLDLEKAIREKYYGND